MSIFRGKDANLPWLTQLLQIDADNSAEVGYIYEKIMDRSLESVHENEARGMIDSILQVNLLIRTLLTDDAFPAASLFWWNANRHTSTVQVYPHKQNGKAITADDVDWFDTTLKLKRSDLKEVDTFDYTCSVVEANIVSDLDKWLLPLLRPETSDYPDLFPDVADVFGVCKECHNPFLRTTLAQRRMFCSFRCAARNGERRRYVSKAQRDAGDLAAAQELQDRETELEERREAESIRSKIEQGLLNPDEIDPFLL